MAVTKQTYTAAPTWTAAQLADLFQSAFVDAGLMTAWYDSFLSGTVENRILEVIYDGTKTYGKTYYWFTFTTTAVGVSVASGWNAATDVPTGTAFLDFFATTTNTQANHHIVRSGFATGTTAELVRYTDSGYSWFALRNGPASTVFFIAPAATSIAPWIDLNKVLFHHFIVNGGPLNGVGASGQAMIEFRSVYCLRRSYYAQGWLRDRSGITSYLKTWPTLSYMALGNGSNNTSNDSTSGIVVSGSFVIVPYGFSNTNPEYATNYLPIINGYSYSNYVISNMPADFGIFFPYGTTAFAFGDRIVVSAGVEEWEVYGFASNTSADAPSALIVARVV
jgi:hypothetical protein